MGSKDIGRKQEFFNERARNERLVGPEIIQPGRAVRYPTSGNTKLFGVVTTAEGDGLYICHELVIDAAAWSDTEGAVKFVQLNDTEVTVFNIAEFDPESEYVAPLAFGDVLVGVFHGKDNANNIRWAGLPFRRQHGAQIRRAFCKAAAGAAATIVCYLDKDGSGFEITVNCDIVGGSKLSEAIPCLAIGTPLEVYKLADGNWYTPTKFQTFDKEKGLVIESGKLIVNIDDTKGLEFDAGDHKLAVNINTTELQFDSGEIETKLDAC
ncbi:MAG TPA: hypothetical protein VMW16_03665 [Sedimentisphaerales bacterium]|nr:hypothetical protein [Sedimentisphaerales bacterium]